MAKNNDLLNAKTAKQDEFYTSLSDVEKEMIHYRDQFEGKTVYCNCDDPSWSAFFKYFQLNFNHLGLKKLISTHFEPTGKSYKLEIVGNGVRNGQSIIPEYIQTDLEGNGDFRSEECLALLDEADFVITNPPFSLFREYVATLEAHGKKYCILGNVNAITYKEIFPLIKDNKLWLGASIHSGDREFRVPDNYECRSKSFRVDEQGNKYVRVSGVRWFTNMDYKARYESIPLYKHYSPEEFPKYDNYDAINVDVTKDIPVDYDGVMGVPITFLDKWNPIQFTIIGIANSARWIGDMPCFTVINGKKIYNRVLIKRN